MATSKKKRCQNPPRIPAKWRSFDEIVSQVRGAFADLRAEELHTMIKEALEHVREEKQRRRKGQKEK